MNAACTVAWATNVGNEFGQVFISVLTAAKESGLEQMTRALVVQYKKAGVSPPELISMDCDCCGARGIKALFPVWNDLCVRLDIWHFMRIIASACRTESHPLYARFMGRLAHCIFEAMELGLEEDHPLVVKSIRKKELALHFCRRTFS